MYVDIVIYHCQLCQLQLYFAKMNYLSMMNVEGGYTLHWPGDMRPTQTSQPHRHHKQQQEVTTLKHGDNSPPLTHTTNFALRISP